MSLILPLLLLAVILVVVGLLSPCGLWSNALNLINVTLAALLATNFFEPVSNYLTGLMPSMVFLVNIFVLWIMFAALLLGLRTATDRMSKLKVKFPKTIEMAGNYAFAALTGWVLVCFGTMTLHTAPLAKDFAFGGFKPESATLFGIYPDRLWLGFVQKMSYGELSRGNEFDPNGDLMFRYAERRSQFERQNGLTAMP